MSRVPKTEDSLMPFELCKCPHCGTTLRLGRAVAPGTQLGCPRCKTRFEVGGDKPATQGTFQKQPTPAPSSKPAKKPPPLSARPSTRAQQDDEPVERTERGPARRKGKRKQCAGNKG